MGSEISAEELKEEEEAKEEPPKAAESRHKTVFLSPEEAAEPRHHDLVGGHGAVLALQPQIGHTAALRQYHIQIHH